MNESLVLEKPRSDGWPGKQPDQEEDDATVPQSDSCWEEAVLVY